MGLCPKRSPQTLLRNFARKPRPLRERVAGTLIEFAVATGKGLQATTQFTHAQLADSLGVTRVSIATALDSLVSLGFISKGYGKIDIANAVALEAFLQEKGATWKSTS